MKWSEHEDKVLERTCHAHPVQTIWCCRINRAVSNFYKVKKGKQARKVRRKIGAASFSTFLKLFMCEEHVWFRLSNVLLVKKKNCDDKFFERDIEVLQNRPRRNFEWNILIRVGAIHTIGNWIMFNMVEIWRESKLALNVDIQKDYIHLIAVFPFK